MKNHKKPIMFDLNHSECIRLVLQIHKSSIEEVYNKRFKKKYSFDIFKMKYNGLFKHLNINPYQFSKDYYETLNPKYIMSEEKTEEELLNSGKYNLEKLEKEIDSEFLLKWSNETTKEPHQITIGELKKMTPEEQSIILKSIL